MLTQWNAGPAGAIGLRYEAMPFALELEQVQRSDWPDVTADVQVLERETMRIWREKR